MVRRCVSKEGIKTAGIRKLTRRNILAYRTSRGSGSGSAVTKNHQDHQAKTRKRTRWRPMQTMQHQKTTLQHQWILKSLFRCLTHRCALNCVVDATTSVEVKEVRVISCCCDAVRHILQCWKSTAKKFDTRFYVLYAGYSPRSPSHTHNPARSSDTTCGGFVIGVALQIMLSCQKQAHIDASWKSLAFRVDWCFNALYHLCIGTEVCFVHGTSCQQEGLHFTLLTVSQFIPAYSCR